MDAYVVIGDAHSYKSTVIRSLSGNRVAGVRPYIILPNRQTTKKVYVHISSLQEGAGIPPAKFVQDVNNLNVHAALFALRPQKKGVFPDADAYLKIFIQSGWTIQRVAILGSTNNPLNIRLAGNCLSCFPFGMPAPAVNKIAHDVRTHFNWL